MCPGVDGLFVDSARGRDPSGDLVISAIAGDLSARRVRRLDGREREEGLDHAAALSARTQCSGQYRCGSPGSCAQFSQINLPQGAGSALR